MKKEKQKKTTLPEEFVKEFSKKNAFDVQKEGKTFVKQKQMPFVYFSLQEPKPEYVKAAQKKTLYRLIKVKN